MKVDRVTAEVLNALHRADVPALLLKGPVHRQWLYRDGELRAYSDTDLLVSPSNVQPAGEVLAGLGFRRGQAGWAWISQQWNRGHDAVDLHRSLLGIGVDDATAWALLSREPSRLWVGGWEADALAPPARALHVALHGAQHGPTEQKPLDDLERALQLEDREVWRQALGLARALSAEGAFATGLRLLDSGAELADSLGASRFRPAAVALRAGAPPPGALGFALLAESSGVRGRLRALARGIAPPPAYMRGRYPLARRGRIGVALAYGVRLVWLGRHAPSAIGAWLRAKRAERAG